MLFGVFGKDPAPAKAGALPEKQSSPKPTPNRSPSRTRLRSSPTPEGVRAALSAACG